MVDLLRALDLRRIMREILVNREVEVECAALVHALIRLDSESEVQDVVGVREGHFHCTSEGELLQVCLDVDTWLVINALGRGVV